MFGNRNDEHHGQQLTDNIDLFRNNMFSSLNIDQVELNSYWNEIKGYRDDFVAHLLSEETMNIPSMDLAWATVEYYHSYVVTQGQMNPEALKGLSTDLKAYYDKS